ncbi:hypothetical protein P280DRAFT_216075 [Massarina eburnea CBS 473.64]|uniref:Uncharacterized protein n=1 Tax=Massarina eburnea CBS 473.64 TaxID=1395130 RepID=A0A6A6S838_9PLEO|nr:hypothetical protein P280DRAFT_216075 [Massarina eburnea CBS 473.64]
MPPAVCAHRALGELSGLQRSFHSPSLFTVHRWCRWRGHANHTLARRPGWDDRPSPHCMPLHAGAWQAARFIYLRCSSLARQFAARKSQGRPGQRRRMAPESRARASRLPATPLLARATHTIKSLASSAAALLLLRHLFARGSLPFHLPHLHLPLSSPTFLSHFPLPLSSLFLAQVPLLVQPYS